MENILDPSQLPSLNTPESKAVLDSSQVQFADSFLNTPSNTQTYSEATLPFDSEELLSSVLSGGPSVGMDSSWEDLEREIANGFGGNNNGDPFSQQIQQAIHSHLTNSNSKSEDQWNQTNQTETQDKKIKKETHNQSQNAESKNYPTFDEFTRFNTTPTNSTPTDTSYDEAVRMWAQQRGINLDSRKRKSEDITDNFAGSLNINHHESDMRDHYGMNRTHHNFTITPAGGPPGRTIDRRNSMPAAPPTHTSSYSNNSFSTTTSTFSPPSALNAAQSPKPGDLDVPAGKSQLLDLICGETEMLSYCNKALNYMCTQLKVRVGGFYVNQRSSIKDWLLYCAYPSSNVFSQFFQLNVGYNLLIQASAEKRCFCVHSTNLSPSSLSFMFVPVPVDDSQNAFGVMVLGTVLGQEDEMHGQLLFLDQIRKTIAASMNSILALQQNNAMIRKLDYLKLENEVLKQKNRFERALIGIISSACPSNTSDPSQLRSDTAIICCDTMGVITYFSPSSQALLGYQPSEIVGRYSPLKFHDPNEILERAKELEHETGKKISVGWSVIIEKTLRNGGVEDVREWNYIKKDGVSIRVNLSIKPLYDDEDQSIIGFLALAKPLN